MIEYKGKSKCGFNCGKRAKFKASSGNDKAPHDVIYACHEHKQRIENLPTPITDSGRLTEADYQTWMKI